MIENKLDQGNHLSREEIAVQSERLFNLLYSSLMDIPAGRTAIEAVEYRGNLSSFKFLHGEWTFEGEINLPGKQISLSKRYPYFTDADGETDIVLRCDVSPDGISTSKTICKVDSGEIIRTVKSAKNSHDALSEAYEFNIGVNEVPPKQASI